MKKSKNLFIFVLLCFAVILLACADGGGSGGQENTDNISADETADNNFEIAPETETPFNAHLPDMDFGGSDLRIVNMNEEYMWYLLFRADAESETGEIINESVPMMNIETLTRSMTV